MAQTGFNTEQFAWSNVSIQVANRVLTGAQGLSYKEDQEKNYHYGKGNKPQSIQRGNYTYSGSLKLDQSELEKLIQGAPNKKLGDYRNLNITIAYEAEDGTSVTDILVGVEFTGVEKALNQGAGQMEVDLPIMFLDIQNNV